MNPNINNLKTEKGEYLNEDYDGEADENLNQVYIQLENFNPTVTLIIY